MGAKLTCKFDLYDDELFDGGDNKHQKYLSYIYDNCIKGAEYIDKSEENDEKTPIVLFRIVLQSIKI